MRKYSIRITVDDLDLGPIEERLAAATPGPWEWHILDEKDQIAGSLGNKREAVLEGWEYWGTGGIKVKKEDREFIANAYTDIPALIAEVKRLREVEEDLRNILDQM